MAHLKKVFVAYIVQHTFAKLWVRMPEREENNEMNRGRCCDTFGKSISLVVRDIRLLYQVTLYKRFTPLGFWLKRHKKKRKRGEKIQKEVGIVQWSMFRPVQIRRNLLWKRSGVVRCRKLQLFPIFVQCNCPSQVAASSQRILNGPYKTFVAYFI